MPGPATHCNRPACLPSVWDLPDVSDPLYFAIVASALRRAAPFNGAHRLACAKPGAVFTRLGRHKWGSWYK